jgi:hypothetical protein
LLEVRIDGDGDCRVLNERGETSSVRAEHHRDCVSTGELRHLVDCPRQHWAPVDVRKLLGRAEAGRTTGR